MSGILQWLIASYPSAPASKHFQVDTGWTLTNGLLHYYKLEDGNDFYWTANGTVTGATFSAGKVNNAGNFSGNSSDKIQTASGLWEALWAFTVNMWVKASSIPWSWFGELLWAFNSSAQYLIWLMIYQSQWYTLQGIGWVNWVIQSWTPSANTWYMVTVTSTGTAFSLYINNSLQASWWSGTFSWTIDFIKIGFWTFPWLIDEFSFHDRAITSTERWDLYNGWSGQTMV